MRLRRKSMAVATLAIVLVLSVSGVALAGGAWSKVTDPLGDCDCGISPPVSQTTSVTVPLSAEEEEQLLFMREEEKLARDVYTALYEEWGAKVFKNIAASESRHMASVKTLLDRYGLEDPVGSDTPGVFVNDELQAAYDRLVAQGSLSLKDAYNVGVIIEELDIADLKALLGDSTHADVTKVAQNLLRGSQNHLRAFSRLVAK